MGAHYVDPYAIVRWGSYPGRSAADVATLAIAAGLWDAVPAARGDDPPPDPTQPASNWHLVGQSRVVVWVGGQADKP